MKDLLPHMKVLEFLTRKLSCREESSRAQVGNYTCLAILFLPVEPPTSGSTELHPTTHWSLMSLSLIPFCAWKYNISDITCTFHSGKQWAVFTWRILIIVCDLPLGPTFPHREQEWGGFPGGPVVKTFPSSAGDVGLIPGQGPKIAHALQVKKPKHKAEAILWQIQERF